MKAKLITKIEFPEVNFTGSIKSIVKSSITLLSEFMTLDGNREECP
jgi:hypothetical protein